MYVGSARHLAVINLGRQESSSVVMPDRLIKTVLLRSQVKQLCYPGFRPTKVSNGTANWINK